MRTTLTTRSTRLLATAAVLLAACGGGGDDADASGDAVGAGGETEEALADELDELGVELSDEELSEAAELLDTSDLSGHAEVTLDGEDVPMEGVTCSDVVNEEDEAYGYTMEARGPGGHFEITFGREWQEGGGGPIQWDHATSIELYAMTVDDGTVFSHRELDVTEVSGTDGQITGSTEISRTQHDEDPPRELVFDLRCD